MLAAMSFVVHAVLALARQATLNRSFSTMRYLYYIWCSSYIVQKNFEVGLYITAKPIVILMRKNVSSLSNSKNVNQEILKNS